MNNDREGRKRREEEEDVLPVNAFSQRELQSRRDINEQEEGRAKQSRKEQI